LELQTVAVGTKRNVRRGWEQGKKDTSPPVGRKSQTESHGGQNFQGKSIWGWYAQKNNSETQMAGGAALNKNRGPRTGNWGVAKPQARGFEKTKKKKRTTQNRQGRGQGRVRGR